jgi:soluble lytic murein transglycosylase-like protein
MPIITESVRQGFLSPEARPLSLDLFKEDYFRTQIPFGEIIYREARRNDLSPELVAAMVHTESDFRPGLVSHKSAQGLMQIVPSTAALLGVDDPFDPAKNIAAGTRYFRYLLDRFDDETMALAAYNAGEGNVARFGGIPPFAETRDYISKVHRRKSRYREGFRNSYIASVRMRRALH